MSWSIQVENLSKMYRTGNAVNPAMDTLYRLIEHGISHGAGKLLGKAAPEEAPAPTGNNLVIAHHQTEGLPPGHFWALKDISFELKQGDRVGIIGKNGSGKSTLLKILSRITTPTCGEFRFRGRLLSLLEVGTGFHPDLSGRENILLNAKINGMSTRGIRRVFDDIVEFSELGSQIDTPIKRYSSGMYMRLAFAVAAHLQSDILIVDEVLAVGDAGFQKKCIDKMLDISGNGRTLLFVSHDMSAVRKLCTHAMLFDHGRLIEPDHALIDETTQQKDMLFTSAEATTAYMRGGNVNRAESLWESEHAPTMDGFAKIRAFRLRDSKNEIRSSFDVTEPITVEIELEVIEKKLPVHAHIYLEDLVSRQRVFFSMDNLVAPTTPRESGYYIERCTIPSPLLNEGLYTVEVLICAGPDHSVNAIAPEQLSFEVLDEMREGGIRGNWNRPWFQSIVRPKLEWSVEKR